VSVILETGSVIFQWVSGADQNGTSERQLGRGRNDAVAEAETATSNEQSTFFGGFRKYEALRRGKYGCPREFTSQTT
jgi:hypothetical protein